MSKILIADIANARVPKVYLTNKVRWCSEFWKKGDLLLWHDLYGKRRSAALAAFVLHGLATKKTALFLTENDLLDAYSSSFGGDVDTWNEVLRADLLVVDSADGALASRNLARSLFLVMEHFINKGARMVLGMALCDPDIDAFYGESASILLREHFVKVSPR